MRSAPQENGFLIPLANPLDERSKRFTWPGFLFTLMLAVGAFGVGMGAPRFFGRRLAGRQGASRRDITSLSQHDASRYNTWNCAGNFTGDPVLEGADLVSYFSLTENQPAMYGTEQYETSYNGYKFWFVSEENKAIFEAEPLRHMPLWGGFCAYGVAEEDWWTGATLGPAADPNSWVILEGNLYFFRSEYPKSLFMENVGLNLKLGEDNWKGWWGDAVPAGEGLGSPLNTACFCNVETCFDY